MRTNRVWQPTGVAKSRHRSRFKIVPFTYESGTQSWRVTGCRRDGSQVRENFSEVEAAKARQLELEVEYLGTKTETTLRATKMTEEQVRLAEMAFVQLGDDWPRMLEAVDSWKRHGKQRPATESPRLDEAVEQYLEWLKASPFRDATKRNWKNRMNVFRNSVQNVRVADVTPEFIEQYLDTRNVSAAGKDTDRRACSRFFSWCIDRKRRWTTTNPCREVKVEQGQSLPPSILTVIESEALLNAAENHKGGLLVPYVAVCLFGGLRPFEVRRLEWSAVNLKDREIRLEASQTKTGRKTGRGRVIEINDTLAGWLEPYQGRSFFPSNWRKEFDVVKGVAGFGTVSEKKPNLKPWPEDVMRHTAISHAFRQSGSYGRCAEAFGNSESIIKKHYQSRVSSADTAKFYALRPTNGMAK